MHNICLIVSQPLLTSKKNPVSAFICIRSPKIELELELKLEQFSPLNAPLVVLPPQAREVVPRPNTAKCILNNKLSFEKYTYQNLY